MSAGAGADDAGGTCGADVETVGVLLRLLDPALPAPAYAHDGDAGADLRSRDDHVLGPGERAVVRTGVALALPDGYVGLVHPRSGLAARHGITVVNAPGTVDAGYRGEILVVLLNTDARGSFRVHRGDRIAQLVVQRFARAEFSLVDWLPGSDRGETGHGASGGFGSTTSTDTPTDTSTAIPTDTPTDTRGPRTGQ